MNSSNTPSQNDPLLALRIAAGVLAFPFILFSLLVLRSQVINGFDLLGVIFGAATAVVAIFFWWVVLYGHKPESRARMRSAAMGGGILGGLGFVGGFVGPIVLTPGANQGPLLGIFITGPLGSVLGALIDWLYRIYLTWREARIAKANLRTGNDLNERSR